MVLHPQFILNFVTSLIVKSFHVNDMLYVLYVFMWLCLAHNWTWLPDRIKNAGTHRAPGQLICTTLLMPTLLAALINNIMNSRWVGLLCSHSEPCVLQYSNYRFLDVNEQMLIGWQVGGCSSGGRTGHLPICRLVVPSPAAPVCRY